MANFDSKHFGIYHIAHLKITFFPILLYVFRDALDLALENSLKNFAT